MERARLALLGREMNGVTGRKGQVNPVGAAHLAVFPIQGKRLLGKAVTGLHGPGFSVNHEVRRTVFDQGAAQVGPVNMEFAEGGALGGQVGGNGVGHAGSG